MNNYTVTLQCSIDVLANFENEAIDKAISEANFGTDLYAFSLVEVAKDGDTNSEEEKA